MPFYLVLADGVLFQQVLVTAADFEDVFTLIFLNTHLQLLWGQQHASCLLTNGLCNHLQSTIHADIKGGEYYLLLDCCMAGIHTAQVSYLFRHTVVVDLQCVLLLVIIWRNNHPYYNNNLTYQKKRHKNRSKHFSIALTKKQNKINYRKGQDIHLSTMTNIIALHHLHKPNNCYR